MDIIYGQCESQLWGRIGAELSGERRNVEKRKLYEVGWRERKEIFGEQGEVKFMFLLIKMCGIGFEFHNNQLGTEVLLNFFFFSQTQRLIFHCAKSVRKD